MLARDIIRRENISTIHVNKRLIIIFLLTKILITIPKTSFIFHRSRDNSKKKKGKKIRPEIRRKSNRVKRYEKRDKKKANNGILRPHRERSNNLKRCKLLILRMVLRTCVATLLLCISKPEIKPDSIL